MKLEGEATHWDIVGDSGNVKTRGFCPTCGSPVYLTFAAMPDLFTVHAASLDDPSRYKPQMVTYHVRGHAWDHARSGRAEIRQDAAGVRHGLFLPDRGPPAPLMLFRTASLRLAHDHERARRSR